MNADTIIIIPAYNEQRSISNIVTEIKKLYPNMDVVVIDDGSTDNTAVLAEQAGAIVLSHPFNMGYGVTIQTGYKYALHKGYNYLVQLDGDGQHDITEIGNLLETLIKGSYNIVIGSRFLGKNNYKPSIYRRIGIRFFRFILVIFSGVIITDPTSGFQAMDKKILEIFIKDIFPGDYPDADILLLLTKLDFGIKEVPINIFPNFEGKSMHDSPLKAIYYIFKMLLSMTLTIFRDIKFLKK